MHLISHCFWLSFWPGRTYSIRKTHKIYHLIVCKARMNLVLIQEDNENAGNFHYFHRNQIFQKKIYQNQVASTFPVLLALFSMANSGRVTYPSPYQPSSALFGASNPAPCCRSNFPDEFGSCVSNEHCPQPTAPYCSAFGFCTQVSLNAATYFPS